MLDFLSSGLFWVFVGVVAISSAIKGFIVTYYKDSRIINVLLMLGLTILNTGVYITSFISLGWLTTLILFILGSMVSGLVAVETRQYLYKRVPDEY